MESDTIYWYLSQKNSAIYKCSKISGKQEIIAEAVSDDEVQYLKGVLHYTDAHGKKLVIMKVPSKIFVSKNKTIHYVLY